MGAEYEIRILTPTGSVLTNISEPISFELTRTVNQSGTLTIEIPYGAYPDVWLQDDSLIEVWRKPDGGAEYLEGGTYFFIHAVSKKIAAGGERYLEVIAPDAIELIKHRIVAYAAGTSQASKFNKPADDALKAYVRENMGPLATDTTRDLTPNLTIAADLSLGPNVSVNESYRNLLNALQDVANAAFTAGSYIAFDLVSTLPVLGAQLEFRTYLNYRGVDRRWSAGNIGFNPPVLLSADNGSFLEVDRTIDNRNMYNAVYAAGQGTGTNRVVKTSIDTTSVTANPWNRHELFVNAAQTSDPNSVQAEADSQLRLHRIRRLFTARLQDTSQMKYGVNFGYGDFITCAIDTELVDVRLDSYTLKVKDKEETLTIVARADS